MKTKKAIRMPLRRAPQRGRPQSAPLRARAATADEDYEEDDYEAGEEPNMKFSHALIVVLVLHLLAVGGVFAFNWMKARQTAEIRSSKPVAAVAAEKTAAPVPALPKHADTAVTAGSQGATHTVAAGDTLTRIATLHGTTIEAIEKENGITTYSMIRVGQVLKIPGGEKSAPVAKSEPPAVEKADSASTAAAKQAFIATKTGATPAKSAATPAKAAPNTVKPTVSAIKPTATVVKPATGTISAVAKPAAETTMKPAEPASAPPAIAGDTYVVAQGDNPYTIAKKLHVSYNDLITINDIKDPTKIQIGQKLKIPKK